MRSHWLLLLPFLLAPGVARAQADPIVPQPEPPRAATEPLVSGAASVTEAPPAVSVQRRLTLISTGRLRGAGGSRAAINSPTLLLDRYSSEEIQVSVVRSGPGVYAHRGRYLVKPGGILSVADFRRAVADLRLRPKDALPVAGLQTDYSLMFQLPPQVRRNLADEMWQQNGQTHTVPELRRVKGVYTPVDSPSGELALYTLDGAEQAAALPVDPRDWERLDLLLSRVGDSAGSDELFLVKRPLGDPARMLVAARDLAKGAGSGSLLLDPGTAWPASTPPPGQSDPALESRLAAGFCAALPGLADLARGATALVKLGTKGLPLISANLLDEEGKAPLPAFRVCEVNDLRIALVGVITGADLRLSSVAGEGLRVIEPGPAAQRAVDGLVRGSTPPDLIVLLSNLDTASTAELRKSLRGVDIMLADFSRPGLVAARFRADFAARAPSEERAFYRHPSIVVRAGAADVLRLDLDLKPGDRGGWILERAQWQTEPVLDGVQRDPALGAVLADQWLARAGLESTVSLPDLNGLASQDERLTAYLRSLPDLYPNLSEAARARYPLRFTDTLFSTLVVNLARLATRAEVAAIRAVNRSEDAPGEITEAQVDRWLETESDSLATLILSGVQLTKLYLALDGSKLSWSGLEWSSKKRAVRVGGRFALPGELYRVALGASLLASPAVRAALTGASSNRLFARGDKGSFVADSRGSPLTIRAMVPAVLSGLREQEWPVALIPQLYPQRAVLEPGFRLQVTGLELRGGDLNHGTGPLEEFSDSRLATGRAASLGASGELAMEVQGSALAWLTTARFTYDAQFPDVGETPAEAQEEGLDGRLCQAALKDDWVASTELRNRRWSLPVGFTAIPYTSLSYDSQFFCPPRQKLLFYGLGAGGRPGPIWQDVRLGLAARYDVEAEDTQPGVQAATRVLLRFDKVRLQSDLGVDYFPLSASSALALDLRWTNSLDMPLGAGLSFRTKSELLVYAVGDGGPEGLRHSLTFGLAYTRTLKPSLSIY